MNESRDIQSMHFGPKKKEILSRANEGKVTHDQKTHESG